MKIRSSQRLVSPSLIAGFAGLALSSAATMAQDSVSSAAGLPGDALNAYTVGVNSNQIANFVVDMTTITTSWGNRYYIAPTVKSSAGTSVSPSPVYFNHLIGAQAVSNRFTPVGPLARTSYRVWNAPLQGVNPLRNNLASTPTINTSSVQAQNFALGFMEFAGGPNTVFGDSDDENNIIGALIGFDPRRQNRLYVSRINAATNKGSAAAGLTSNASFGLGGIDDNGTIVFYADGFAMNGPDVLSTRNWYRVNIAARSASLVPQIRASLGLGDAAATVRLLNLVENVTTPTLIPASVAGRTVAVGLDFLNNLRFEQTAGSAATTTQAYLPAGAAARGPMGITTGTFAQLSNGTSDAGVGSALSRGASATKTRGLSFWGLNTDGSVDNQIRLELPTSNANLFDRADNFNPGNTFGSLGNHEFMNYQSQVCFRGGNGPVAMTVLPSGDLLAAAGVAATGGAASVPQSMDNYLAVARVPAAGGPAVWTVAAHSGSATGANSKLILGSLDGQGTPDPNNPIGRIARYSEVFPSATNGPSISAPAMDRMGNLYFIATIQLFATPQNINTVGLIRANYDAATDAYQLELLVKLNDVLPGLNSTRNYQIQFFGPADADSVDSGATWSGNIVQDFNARQSAPPAAYGTPISLGALAFRAKIVYDYDQNSTFVDPTFNGGVGADQAYNVVFVVLPAFKPADVANTDGDPSPDGFVDNGDFTAFFNAFFLDSSDPNRLIADVANTDAEPGPDGTVDNGDFTAFFASFFGG